MAYKRVYLKAGKEESLQRFHPWIFSGAIHHFDGEPEEGEVVDIYTSKNDSERKKTTFRVKGSNYKKTLDEKDIKDISEKVRNSIEKEFDAKLE